MTVRHALLALLSDGPKYGLQLREEFELGTGEVWPLNAGQVYTTLRRLERDGMVASDAEDDGGPQQHYRLTDAGAEELQAWLASPSDPTHPPRDELVIKVLVAIRIRGVDVAALLQQHRRALVEAMQHFTAMKASADPDDLGTQVVADAEVFRIDAVIRWLDSTEARLRHAGDVVLPSRAPAAEAPRQRAAR